MAPNQMDWDAETNRYLKAKIYHWLRYRITSEDEPKPIAPPLPSPSSTERVTEFPSLGNWAWRETAAPNAGADLLDQLGTDRTV